MKYPLQLLSGLALLLALLLLAGCVTPGAARGDGGAGGSGGAGGEPESAAPSTDPVTTANPWRGNFPREVEERGWEPRKEGENVLVHEGVLLRASAGWLFFPRGEEDPESLVVRARRTTGASDVAVHLLPREAGFTQEVLTEEYVRRAIRRVMGGSGAPTDSLRRVTGGRDGDLVYLARGFEAQVSVMVRAIATDRGLYVITGAGATPRDASATSGVIGSFETVSTGVSLRIPNEGPALFAPPGEAGWISDSREGSLFSVPGGGLMLVATPWASLPEVPGGEVIRYTLNGELREAEVVGPGDIGRSSVGQVTLSDSEATILLLGWFALGPADSSEELHAEVAALLSRRLVDREPALEAIR